MQNCGWSGSFKEFLEVDPNKLVNELCMFVYKQNLQEAKINPKEDSTISQMKAWFDSIHFLKKELSSVQQWGSILFEFSIIRGGGRRPDVLLLLPGEVLVLEFKGFNQVNQAEYNQTSLYVRDLVEYYSPIQNYDLKVRGALVLPNSKTSEKLTPIYNYQVYQLAVGGVNQLIEKIINKQYDSEPLSVKEFLDGVYQPLPSIIESARAIMRDEELPQIKTLKSSNFEEVTTEVKRIVQLAKKNNTHHLVLVSGVPGAGKTFVGLTLAHDLEKAVYLSGNGPLIEVLQDCLGNKTFVQALYNYKTDYLNHKKMPDDQVIIFDEAQRAWDKQKMKIDKSEPDIIIEIAKEKSWSVVVGLIGEGQEIHLGEEGGIDLWNQSIKGKEFYVHAKYQQEIFPYALKYVENKQLHLNTSLRTHKALLYFEWVEAFITGNSKKTEELEAHLKEQRYLLKRITSLAEAKEYVEKLYSGTNKKYGIITSSANKWPKNVKILPFSERYVHPKSHVAYFNYPESEYYSNNLNYAATEFHVQGLELDMAIVLWSSDLIRKQGNWNISQLKEGAQDPRQMKLNAYRVLLTRGRDGTIICHNGEIEI